MNNGPLLEDKLKLSLPPCRTSSVRALDDFIFPTWSNFSCYETDFSTKNQDNVCFFQPKTIHDRTQVFLGNSDEIEELQKYLKGLKWKKIDWERGDLDSKIDQ